MTAKDLEERLIQALEGTGNTMTAALWAIAWAIFYLGRRVVMR